MGFALSWVKSLERGHFLVGTVGNIQTYQGLALQGVSSVQSSTQAIRQASAKTGVDFAYLLSNASQESGLNPTVKAKSSSATGLFQFVEQTWLRMVKTYGDKYGMADAASRITLGSDGVARVSDPQAKRVILALRNDPKASAEMAAELTKENKVSLEGVVGGKIGSTDLYLAHFLGAGGAADFISAVRSNPNAKAASVVPEAAVANPSVFYDKSGKPRTLAQVYDRFAEKFNGSAASVVASGKTNTTRASRFVSQVASAHAVGASFAASSLGANGFRPDTSMTTPFATMMIAQMDVDSLSMTAKTEAPGGADAPKKKSALSLLGAVS
jgi:hypothetical protein